MLAYESFQVPVYAGLVAASSLVSEGEINSEAVGYALA